MYVPYRTFPFAGRRGTTVIDRSTAYPLFGVRAGRRAFELARDGAGRHRSRIRRERASGTRDGAASRIRAPGWRDGAAGAQSAGARGIRRDRSVARAAQAGGLLAAAPRGARVRARGRRRHRHRSRARAGRAPPPAASARADAHDPERARPARRGRLDRSSDGRRMRLRHDIGPASSVLLSVGRLEDNKGFHVMLRALAAVRDHGGLDGQPWRWVVLGDGPYRPMLQTLAAELNCERRVRFLGRMSDDGDARVARARDAVRASDLVRRQFARHARSDGAPPRGRRDDGGRPARQGRPA